MTGLRIIIAALCVATAAPGLAIPLQGDAPQRYWQCVPIARMLSGIEIYGDAHTWWGQAEGRYDRGDRPRRGAVLAFMPHGNMRLGHVAAVTRIVDDRTIYVTHSNWSPINGTRGQIEHDVKIIDVSDANDWSAVRVWFAPSQSLGTTAWPTHGFIYPRSRPPLALPASVAARPAPAPSLVRADEEPAPRMARLVLPASVAKLARQEASLSASPAPEPTGRLAYLGKALRKLR